MNVVKPVLDLSGLMTNKFTILGKASSVALLNGLDWWGMQKEINAAPDIISAISNYFDVRL